MHKKTEIDKTRERLMESLNHGRGIKHILNIAYKILGNPIVMFDTSYNLLASTENAVSDDPLWNELIENGKFSHDTVHFFYMEQFIANVAITGVVTSLKSDKLKYDRICGKLFDKDNIYIGDIVVVACYRPFRAEDFDDIATICELISVEMQQSNFHQKVEHVFHETFISDIICGKINDKPLIEYTMENLYMNLKTDIYLAVVDITPYEYTLTHLSYFRDLFEGLQNEFKYFIYLNNIVMIISTDNKILNIKRDLTKLYEFFMKYNIFAGISSSFQNLFEMQKYYKQALNALNYGMNISSNQRIFKYDNFRVDCFINSVKDSTNVRDLCDPVVFLIQEYDKENNTVYYDIIFTYLLVGKNSQLTCEKMEMDHDELCGQLKKIEEIFEIDWDNGNMLFGIFSSIKILECLTY